MPTHSVLEQLDVSINRNFLFPLTSMGGSFWTAKPKLNSKFTSGQEVWLYYSKFLLVVNFLKQYTLHTCTIKNNILRSSNSSLLHINTLQEKIKHAP